MQSLPTGDRNCTPRWASNSADRGQPSRTTTLTAMTTFLGRRVPRRLLRSSMGSTMAWRHTALVERIAACVTSCSLTDDEAVQETRGLDRYALNYYVPGLMKHSTTAQVNALIYPRPRIKGRQRTSSRVRLRCGTESTV